MKQHDEDMVQGWKENIDTLLVFVSYIAVLSVGERILTVA